MIRLNVFIQAAEGKRAEILETAKELVAASLKEEGCVAYDIFASGTRENVLLFCETWKDQAALDAHANTPHFKGLLPKIQRLGVLKIESFPL